MRLGIILLLFSLLIGGIAAYQTKTKLDSVDQKRSACFLKLQSDLAVGETLGAERSRGAFTRECFTPNARLAEIAIMDTTADRQWVAGRTAAVDIPRGVLLLRQFFDRPGGSNFDMTQIPKDRRAITIGVNESSSVGQFIRPGSFVDVIGVFEVIKDIDIEGEIISLPELAAKTIIQDVEILAAGRVTSEGGTQGLYDRGLSYRSVTLNVTPEQAELLVFANTKAQGGLILSLRRHDDRGQVKIDNIDFNEVIGSELSNGEFSIEDIPDSLLTPPRQE